MRNFLNTLVNLCILIQSKILVIDFDITKLVNKSLPIWLNQNCACIVQDNCWTVYLHFSFKFHQVIDLGLQLLALPF
jgi:hypothetical protein